MVLSNLLFYHYVIVQVRLQALKYTNVIQCALQTMQQEAAAGFFKGMLFPFLAAGFLHSIYFSGYRVTINLLSPGSVGVNHYIPKHSHVQIYNSVYVSNKIIFVYCISQLRFS